MNTDIASLPGKWRTEAATARKVAETPKSTESGITLCVIAENMEQLANELESALAALSPAPSAPVGWRDRLEALSKQYSFTSGVGAGIDRAIRELDAMIPAAPSVPDLDAMVSRFLGWRLPDDFAPDNGISFTPISNPAWTHDTWPTGTNLLHAGQARAMFAYCIEGAAPSVSPAVAGDGLREFEEGIRRDVIPQIAEQQRRKWQGAARLLAGIPACENCERLEVALASQIEITNRERELAENCARRLASSAPQGEQPGSAVQGRFIGYIGEIDARAGRATVFYESPQQINGCKAVAIYAGTPPAPAADHIVDANKMVEARGVEGMVLVPRDKLLELADILYDNRTTTASGLPVTVLECIDVAQAAAQEIRRYIAAAPNPVRAEQPEIRGAWPAALDWPHQPYPFTVRDEPGEHDPCYLVMPGGEMLAFNHHATNGVDQARAQFVADACNAARLDPASERVLAQRDRYHEIADELANGIAAHFGWNIGEHSILNDPWQNALAMLSAAPSRPVVDEAHPTMVANRIAQARAFESVCDLLDGISPGWSKTDALGGFEAMALDAIRLLAGRPGKWSFAGIDLAPDLLRLVGIKNAIGANPDGQAHLESEAVEVVRKLLNEFQKQWGANDQ